jgi:hypothetical protein
MLVQVLIIEDLPSIAIGSQNFGKIRTENGFKWIKTLRKTAGHIGIYDKDSPYYEELTEYYCREYEELIRK